MGLCFEFWCSSPLSTIFQLYRGDQCYWRRKPEYPEKTIDQPHVTDKLDHKLCRNERIHICNILPLQRAPI
jgi:hypothetical protein